MNANQEYKDKWVEVANALFALTTKLNDHKDRQAGNPNDWGYVGDLEYVRDGIEEITKHFG